LGTDIVIDIRSVFLFSQKIKTMKKILTSIALVSAFTIFGLAGIASAQTATDTTGVTPTYQTTGTTGTTGTSNTAKTTSGSSTVGVPNTGAGGDAPMNYAILATSAAIAIAAAAYAFRKPQMR